MYRINPNYAKKEDSEETSIDTKENVFKLLHPAKYDANTVFSKKLILQYYQTIPKYYLMNSDDINVLVYNAKTGSGKSITGVFTFMDRFRNILLREFNRSFINDDFTSTKYCGNIFVVSVWSGVAQIADELLRPEFGYVDEITEKRLRKLTSNIKEEREEAEALKNALLSKLKKYIYFLGYQAFFNMIMGEEISKKSLIQDIDALLSAYRKGEIELSETVRNKLKNSVIIVDEMQKLYSSDGMNSFGFCLMLVSKLAKELNIKMMFMSGTVFNSSPKEIVDVLNIIRPEKDIIPYEDYLNPVNVSDDLILWGLRDEKVDELMRLYSKQFIYYNPSMNIVNKPKLLDIETDLKGFYIYHDENNTKAIVYEKMPNLPQEIYVGSTVISDEDDVVPFIVFQCITSGMQRDEYAAHIKNILASTDDRKREVTVREDIDEDDHKNSISIRDAYIPKTDRLKHGIIESSGLFIGKFLQLENLKNYSTIGYNLTKLVIENARHNEKTVIYHNKLKNFGIWQYCKILEANGCYSLNDRPKDESICKRCGCRYKTHSKPIEERLKERCCNNFNGIMYTVLTGDASESERAYIKTTFNSRLNLYGNLVSCIFVSNVAYSGVSFLNTNNLVMLSPISDISKWKQISARIIRTKSHAALPEQKQIAKIYTFVVNNPNEVSTFKKLNKYTLSERYYRINVKENNMIDKFVNSLSKICIGNALFNDPDSYKPSANESKKLMNMFVNDVHQNITTVVERVFSNDIARTWRYENFIKRLMDADYITYFFDLSTMSADTLKNIIVSMKNIRVFNYSLEHINYDENVKKSIEKKLFIEMINTRKDSAETLAVFPFSTIATAMSDPKALVKLMEKLKSAETFQSKITLLQPIMKYVGKRFQLLVDFPEFWQTMYDIHNEFYDTDPTEFFKNHHSKNRNITKMTGCYYGDYIVYKDGTSKLLDYVFPTDMAVWQGIPYLFRINSRINSVSSPFYLHLVIIEKTKGSEVIDGRKLIKGISCTSYKDIGKLAKSLGLKETVKKLICREMMQFVIDKQAEDSKTHAVYSPYEK